MGYLSRNLPDGIDPVAFIDALRHAEYMKSGGALALLMALEDARGTESEGAARAAYQAERERVRLLYPDES